MRLNARLAHPFVHASGGRLRNVKRSDVACLRKAHEEIALLLRKTRKARSFVAHNERELACHRRIPDALRSLFARASNPKSALLQAIDELGDVSHLRDRKMSDRSCRALVRCGIHMGASFVGDHHTTRTNHFSRTRDGPKIARIRNMVEHHDERIAVVLLRMRKRPLMSACAEQYSNGFVSSITP